MSFFGDIYNLFLFQPVLNALVWIAELVPTKDFGVAIVILTVAVRGASYPLGAQAIRAQKKFAELQPKMKEIREKFKDKREEQTRAMLQLYKDAKVNPLATMLPLLIQLPIFIVFAQMFSRGLSVEQFSDLYPFIQVPEEINTVFLGVFDLSLRAVQFDLSAFRVVDAQIALLPIALGAGVLQFLQLKQMQPKQAPKKKKSDKPDMGSVMQKQMLYVFPPMIAWISAVFPAAFGLYIVTTTAFTMWQHWFITRKERPESS